MSHISHIPPPPKPRSAESYLEGLGVIIMLKMRKRIIERLEESDTRFWMLGSVDPGNGVRVALPFISQGDNLLLSEPASPRDRSDFADWMIRRMAQNRLRDGKQMDSILAASYKAFLPQLMAQALRKSVNNPLETTQ